MYLAVGMKFPTKFAWSAHMGIKAPFCKSNLSVLMGSALSVIILRILYGCRHCEREVSEINYLERIWGFTKTKTTTAKNQTIPKIKNLNQTSGTFENIIEECIFKLKKVLKLTNMKEHNVHVIWSFREQVAKTKKNLDILQ